MLNQAEDPGKAAPKLPQLGDCCEQVCNEANFRPRTLVGVRQQLEGELLVTANISANASNNSEFGRVNGSNAGEGAGRASYLRRPS